MHVILHIGQQKTGSTSIQSFLEKNRKTLIEKDMLYPETFGRQKQVDLLNKHSELVDSNSTLLKTFQSELKRHSKLKKVILSEENLFACKAEKRANVGKFIQKHFQKITLVVYLRRQDEHIPSHYQQVVKGKVHLRLDDWIDMILKAKSNYYYYDKIISAWQEVIGPCELQVVPFDDRTKKNLIRDFMAICTKEILEDFDTDIPRLNESIDLSAIELLRQVNLLQAKEKINLSERQKSKIREYLIKTSDKTRLKLSSEQQQKVAQATLASNRRLIKIVDIQKNRLKKYLLETQQEEQPIKAKQIDIVQKLLSYIASNTKA